ncbi:hypothetical protein AALO_G00154760 [Alosa alosa]|uniref:Uncharacterized protein n=1 Tax=Alosa alosa TaxID=278164 RepID=A0AAV6GEZ2_9TELE|nr:hypothetical protein AALO_G00154760 [Alosa alosa]
METDFRCVVWNGFCPLGLSEDQTSGQRSEARALLCSARTWERTGGPGWSLPYGRLTFPMASVWQWACSGGQLLKGGEGLSLDSQMLVGEGLSALGDGGTDAGDAVELDCPGQPFQRRCSGLL